MCVRCDQPARVTCTECHKLVWCSAQHRQDRCILCKGYAGVKPSTLQSMSAYSIAKLSKLRLTSDMGHGGGGQMWLDPKAGVASSAYDFFQPSKKASLYEPAPAPALESPASAALQGVKLSTDGVHGVHVPVAELSREL